MHAKGFKLGDFAEKPPFPSYSFFSLRTAKRAAIILQKLLLSMFNDCVQQIRRPFPHATTITRGGQIESAHTCTHAPTVLQYIVHTLRRVKSIIRTQQTKLVRLVALQCPYSDADDQT